MTARIAATYTVVIEDRPGSVAWSVSIMSNNPANDLLSTGESPDRAAAARDIGESIQEAVEALKR